MISVWSEPLQKYEEYTWIFVYHCSSRQYSDQQGSLVHHCQSSSPATTRVSSFKSTAPNFYMMIQNVKEKIFFVATLLPVWVIVQIYAGFASTNESIRIKIVVLMLKDLIKKGADEGQ